METIIYGGAFDPPQQAHANIAEQIVRKYEPSRLIILPSGPRRDKAYKVQESHRRVIMRIFSDALKISSPNIELCEDFMLGKAAPNTTLNTDRYFRERLGYSPRQVFGVDVIPHMQDWDPSGKVEKVIPKIFVTRPGYIPDLTRVENYDLFDPEFTGDTASLSSTLVRQKIKMGVYVGLHPEVEQYIRQENLYQ